MRLCLCSKLKYLLKEHSEMFLSIFNKKAVVLPWSFPDDIGSEDLEEKWIQPGMKKYYDNLIDFGYQVIVENCFTKTYEEIEKDIQESGLLIITGGNPHMLLKQILPYKQILERYEGYIVGESAGAEVFFDDYYILKENSFIEKQEHLFGLNIIKEFYMDVHSIEEKDYIDRLKNIAINNGKSIYYVDNESALTYDTKTKEIKCLGNARKI